eukprot:TRINITY_DN8617_c8_g1_i1.p1 TRINITY_DN8617_c8_g1~~TRINITY_DN8617_c8_g1_i1.p1  ORF type:complete len:305 (+),score=56.20 TRINITY_DN8617_c8_g1_i1:84-917(+)
MSGGETVKAASPPNVEELFTKVKCESGNSGLTLDEYALAVHAVLLKEGYEPTDKEHKTLDHNKTIPENWKTSEETYCFHYRHERSCLKYIVKIISIGGKVVALLADDQETSKVTQAVYPLKPTCNLADVTSASVTLTLPFGVPTPHAPPQVNQPVFFKPAVPTQTPIYRQPESRDPLRDYGRGDLTPGGGPGGNLMGPEAFRGDPRDRYGALGPDGNFYPPPNGARFDPIAPHSSFGGEPDNDLTPYMMPGANNPPGFKPFGFGGGGGGGGPPGMFM